MHFCTCSGPSVTHQTYSTWYYWIPASSTILLNAVLNCLLVSCILFGWPIDEELLKLEDKMYAIYFFIILLLMLLLLTIIAIRSYLNSPKP